MSTAFTFGLKDFKILHRDYMFDASLHKVETGDFNLQIPTIRELTGMRSKRNVTSKDFGEFGFTVYRTDSTTSNELRNMCYQNVIFYPYGDIMDIAIPSIAIIQQTKYKYINGFDAFEIQIMSRFKTAVIDWLDLFLSNKIMFVASYIYEIGDGRNIMYISNSIEDFQYMNTNIMYVGE